MSQGLRVLGACVLAGACAAAEPWLVFRGEAGPGQGKHIVLVSGDEEYRSEEALPQLAKILALRHGFRTTVLFAIDPGDGTINPDRRDNIPGLHLLREADLMVIFVRFRDLPDEQMKHIVEYVESGRPIVGMRTATHAFDLKSSATYSRYSWNSKEWEGGFGRQVLGETWIRHHGKHGKQSTRGILVPDERGHPILRGIRDGDIWGPTDVYAVRLPLPGDSRALVLGQVLDGMTPQSPPAPGPVNDPMMPVAWVKSYRGAQGKVARVFTTTMGSSEDLLSEGFRRLLVNACYWALGMEDKIAPEADVRLVGDYRPRPFGFGGFARGLRPHDLR
ncbi:MAG: ThuA domain-containing protein [Bryobacterales bacterium]|nr:ThuA domain-containing protein [Bryobacteraceae bacterium]MDW8131259.1 ThuA domain-containing protein [Bryobacterales bacterium]